MTAWSGARPLPQMTAAALSTKQIAMDTSLRSPPSAPSAIDILSPLEQTAPLVFASPHSGRDYPAEFLAEAALDPHTLRRSEDSFVDELFAAAPRWGAPLLRALFPRAYI